MTLSTDQIGSDESYFHFLRKFLKFHWVWWHIVKESLRNLMRRRCGRWDNWSVDTWIMSTDLNCHFGQCYAFTLLLQILNHVSLPSQMRFYSFNELWHQTPSKRESGKKDAGLINWDDRNKLCLQVSLTRFEFYKCSFFQSLFLFSSTWDYW